MELKDLAITPFYLIFFSAIAIFIRPYVTSNRTRKYFLPALWVRFGGAVALGLVYQFYYGYGDTFSFWQYGSQHIWDAFIDNPISGLSMIFGDASSIEHHEYYSKIWHKRSASGMIVVKFAAFFDLFTLHTYSATALFFALMGFFGSWIFFNELCMRYQRHTSVFAVSILFIPSIIFWGSGIMKDTLTTASLFVVLYVLLFFLRTRRIKPIQLLMLTISLFLIFKIKIYILLVFIPCISLLFYLEFQKRLRNVVSKLVISPILILLIFFGGYFGSIKLSESDERYDINNLAKRSQITAYDIRFWTGKDAGSGYFLGEHDGTWIGMLNLAPTGIFTAIFRPFIWESNSMLMILSAIESTVLLILFIRWIANNGIISITNDSFLIMILIFVIVFAFAIGVSTYNFGTLVRYRIPILPFLFILFSTPRIKAKVA